jgi:AbiU2
MIISRLNNPDPRIPEKLRQPYAHLVGIVIETLGVLDELTILYSTSKEAIDVMNKTAPTFFNRHQELLIHYIILSISRLTDKKESGPFKNRQQNLTLERLLDLEEAQHGALLADLTKRLELIRTDAKPVREYRHKLLAHAGLAEYLSLATLGEDITVGSMRDLLRQIGDYLVAFECFFTSVDSSLYYPRSYGEADDLLEYLKLGVEAENKQNEDRLAAATASGQRES